MAYDAGLKVGVDGEQEFKSSLNELNSDLKLFGSELKAVTAEFGRNDKSIEGLTAKNKIYGKEVDTQKSKVQLLTSQYEKQWDELEKLGKNLDDVKKIYGENSKEVEKAQKAYDKQETSVKKLESSLTVATSTLNKLEKQMATNTKELALQSSEWTKLGGKLDDVGSKLGKTGDGITSVGQGVTLGLTTPILAAGVAAGIVAGQFDNASAQIQSSLGLTEAEAKKLEDTAKNVWQNGFGESLEEVTDALLKVKQNMKDVADGAELEKVTQDAITLAQTFDADVNEVTRAGNNLMVNFGLTSSVAFDLMAAGAQNGLNFSQEMFDNLSEYSGLFADMGFSAEEYFQILVNGSEAGVYNLDYINDVMKEFQIRVKDGSDATATAMGQMSESTQEVWESFLVGNGTVKDVSNTVLTELKGMDDQVLASQLGVSLFGTKWEDLESEAMYSLTTVGGEMSNVTGTMDNMVEAQGKTFDTRWNETIRQSQAALLPLGESLLDLAIDYLPKISAGIETATEWFDKLSPAAKDTTVGLAGIVAAIGPVTTGVGVLTKGVGLATTAVSTITGAIGVMTTGAVAATPAIAGTATALTVLTGPIGIVVGALALLTAGGVVLHDVMTKGKQLTEEQIKANDAFIASSTAVAGAVATNITARSDSIKASQDEAMAAQELSVKLFDLADKQNKSGAEMQQLTSYVDQFNQLMPNANLLIDEQTGALNLTRDATNELIAAETERIQKQAVNEALVQNAKDQLATKRELNEAQIRQNQLEQEYAQGMQAVIDGEGTKNEKQQKANELWAKYQEQLGPVTESVTTLTAKQGDLATEQANLNGLLADPSGWNAYISGTNTAEAATVSFADGSTKKIEELGTTAPILMAQTGTNSAIALQNSLIAGTPGITAATVDIHDTVKETTDPLVPELTKTGDDGAHGLGQSILNQQPWIKTNSQLAHDTVKNTTDPLVPELTKTGSDSGYGLGGGLGSQNAYVGENATLIKDTATENTDPLRENLAATGSDSGQNLSDSLESKNYAIGVTSQTISDNVKGKFSPLPGVIGGYGEDSGQGYIDGLNSKKGGENGIESTSSSIVQLVLATFKKGLGIQSPSKEFFEMGAYSMEGFFNGLSAENIVAFANGIVEDIKAAFANKKFSLQGAVEFIGSGAMEFLKSIGVGGASMGDLTSPLSGSITSEFGTRIHPITGEEKFHAGIDIGAAEGTPVGAAGAGEVSMAGWYGGYGNAVMIDHGNGLQSLYGHLSAIMVSVGDLVTQLQTIGLVGSTGNSTGPHLHFELRQDGSPIDPSALFGFDVGSRYVPRDMVAMIHEGEMIVPKQENPYANSGGSITGGLGQGVTQNVYIYSPTSLSPAQISKQSKYALRDMILSL
jgi:murein DD-endopeptidase MepM/ murein hydrolase activator NlpD